MYYMKPKRHYTFIKVDSKKMLSVKVWNTLVIELFIKSVLF